MISTKLPFRADHFGSLLRPPELLEARERRQRGELSAQAPREIEDRCIGDVVKLQEDIGLESITDGEYRPTIWHADFLRQIDGVVVKQGVAAETGVARKFQSGDEEIQRTPTRFEIATRLKPMHGIEKNNFAYPASVTKHTAKLCIPSPTILHMRGGRNAADKVAYPDMENFFADLAMVYRDEIRALSAVGCRYL